MKTQILAILLGASALTVPAASQSEMLDVLIVGGTVYLGDLQPGRVADVGLRGDRIAFVGDAQKASLRAVQTVDARGMIVAPGLIDVHTHAASDLTNAKPASRLVPNHTLQGVSTVFVGNDGDGAAEVHEFAKRYRVSPGAVNVAQFVGFGAVRKAVIGDAARAPNDKELVTMRASVANAMCEGAFGFSAGLYYAPQSFAKTDEVVALAREAAVRGGLYDTHLRDESSDNIGLIAAVEEALTIGREAGMPVHLAHIKAQGVDVHGKSSDVIAMVERAQRSGLKVTADQYTWLASGTRLTNALVPRWAMDGGKDAMAKRLDDPALKSRLDPAMVDNLRRRGGPDSILLTSGPYQGKTLTDLGKQWQIAPLAAALRVIREEGDARIASFNMTREDQENFARQPWVVSSSDASEGHPRKFGSMPIRWRLLVRERGVLTPEQFIHRSTGLTADIYGIADRGYLKPGAFADVLVFDPANFRERADFTKPREFSEGVLRLFVNGVTVVKDGKATGDVGGRPLLKVLPQDAACPA